MLIEKKEKSIIITSDESSFSEFYSAFSKKEELFKNENIILRISDKINVSKKDFLLFLDLSNQKRENGTSFVAINSTLDIDEFPENFNIVPTLQEALDIVEMESIERELGF